MQKVRLVYNSHAPEHVGDEGLGNYYNYRMYNQNYYLIECFAA